ncbi:MAG: helix-turn-helix domain-containing protein [Peptostreptococcus sp.]|uniref:helix-turn-helix domain-containing protein n=1 Tax=Peptostreptococcus sp. TaxID=1262 RepID=UPI0029148D70|nr:helix-turn-helix domain-containing protein [Peptostreptococcus sp.]MDU5350008.1 helix-turn-helix domain-containing protein [Peptostreptococcus sp.]MDU5891844.1 helix-turn-helix domain-containing protein [Peptostreptococcus sp.]
MKKIENIKIFREKKEVSTRNIAILLGMSHRNYFRMEKGEVDFKLSSLLKLCLFFECTPNDLLNITKFEDIKDLLDIED